MSEIKCAACTDSQVETLKALVYWAFTIAILFGVLAFFSILFACYSIFKRP